jgi:hypothetical protein
MLIDDKAVQSTGHDSRYRLPLERPPVSEAARTHNHGREDGHLAVQLVEIRSLLFQAEFHGICLFYLVSPEAYQSAVIGHEFLSQELVASVTSKCILYHRSVAISSSSIRCELLFVPLHFSLCSFPPLRHRFKSG